MCILPLFAIDRILQTQSLKCGESVCNVEGGQLTLGTLTSRQKTDLFLSHVEVYKIFFLNRGKAIVLILERIFQKTSREI